VVEPEEGRQHGEAADLRTVGLGPQPGQTGRGDEGPDVPDGDLPLPSGVATPGGAPGEPPPEHALQHRGEREAGDPHVPRGADRRSAHRRPPPAGPTCSIDVQQAATLVSCPSHVEHPSGPAFRRLDTATRRQQLLVTGPRCSRRSPTTRSGWTTSPSRRASVAGCCTTTSPSPNPTTGCRLRSACGPSSTPTSTTSGPTRTATAPCSGSRSVPTPPSGPSWMGTWPASRNVCCGRWSAPAPHRNQCGWPCAAGCRSSSPSTWTGWRTPSWTGPRSASSVRTG
jgi:hypothetical protein